MALSFHYAAGKAIDPGNVLVSMVLTTIVTHSIPFWATLIQTCRPFFKSDSH